MAHIQLGTTGTLSVPRTMQAAVLGTAGEMYVRERAVPHPGSEDVLVRVRRASLCGTDLKILNRTFFKDVGPAPGEFTPGHEYAGIVAAIGDSVTEFAVGDRVVTEAHRGCMRCTNCLRGSYTDCLNYGLPEMGHRTLGMTVNGGFAEYVVNHVSTLHRLPETVSFDEAVILTTVGTVMHAFDVLNSLVAGATVAVIGPGPIGLLAVQVAKQLGASFVTLVGTRDSRLQLAEQFGADLVINSTTEDAVQAVRSHTNGLGAEIVIECSGAPTAVSQALHMSSRAGRVVLVGFFNEPVLVDLNFAVMNGVTMYSVRGEGSGSIQRAVTLATQGRLDLAPLITHHFPLSEISTAFEVYAERRDNAMKVMLDISEEGGLYHDLAPVQGV